MQKYIIAAMYEREIGEATNRGDRTVGQSFVLFLE